MVLITWNFKRITELTNASMDTISSEVRSTNQNTLRFIMCWNPHSFNLWQSKTYIRLVKVVKHSSITLMVADINSSPRELTL